MTLSIQLLGHHHNCLFLYLYEVLNSKIKNSTKNVAGLLSHIINDYFKYIKKTSPTFFFFFLFKKVLEGRE